MWSSNLDTSITSEGGFLDSSRKDQDDGKMRRVQTIVPFMIKHLLSTPSTEDVKLWDIPARTITALKWLEADKKESDRTIEMNTYVRILGLLREQNDKRHVLILRMWSLQNLNELTNHILEVTYATLKAKAMTMKTEIGHQRCESAANEIPDENSPYYGMTADQTIVYKIIHAQNDTESGIERSDIKTNVPSRILREVDNILDFLVSEGHIYTTSTDDHFKTT
ncbi:Replication protein A 32 kDa subunit [Eufriesea mexicana]|uniref:Replication protein A 32 kDa subunit n=1 Tax=Eufriesea mexicana TaxID=516756 RepID=A0A310S7P9_9HYME|nr:Replication protein A 32 kDa subunit [Eufriesea mexicana]